MVNTLISQFEEHDRRIFWTFAFLFALVLGLYIYFLGVSVYAVIARKQAERESVQTNAQISQLESSYVALDKNISLLLAHERGYSDISVPHYISQEVTKRALTLRDSDSDSAQ